MTTSPRALIILSMSLFLLAPVGVGPASSEAQEKEGATETPAPRSQHPPPASDNQPTPHKPSSESKPPSQSSPSTKSDSSADHKEAAPEKSAPSKPSSESKPPPQASPSMKSDSSAEQKEGAPEKPVPHKPSGESKPPQASPPAKEGAPEKSVPHKPSGDSKPHPTPHKPPAESKPQPQPSPPTKADSPPVEPDGKEKEPVVKKPLGSLILTVKLALMGDPRLFRYEIEVEDDQQTVILIGRVSTEEEKAAATEVAQAVPGVKTVVNKLAVEKDLAKALLKKQDEILTGLIKERFSKSATLKAANFDVKTEDGVVQLNGSVRFQVIALEAAEAARQVPGVRAVNTEKIRLEGES
jgi:hypothetical protein